MSNRLLRCAALLSVVLFASSCGSSTMPSTSNPYGNMGGVMSSLNVTVGNNFFSPTPDTVAVGSKVVWTWTNTGTVNHSVQSTGSPSFASSTVQSGNGTTYSVTFPTAGTYTYNCAVHGASMAGTIVVK